MLHSLSCKISNFLLIKNCFPKDEYDIYVYGTELIISSIIGNTLILLCGIILNCFIETIFYLITFLVLRSFTGGYHSNTYIKCNIVSVSSFLLSIGVYKVITMTAISDFSFAAFIFSIISLIIIIKKAPVENPNKPIDEEDKKGFKTKSAISAVIFTVVSITFWIINIYQGLMICIALFAVAVAMLFKSNGEVKQREKNS